MTKTCPIERGPLAIVVDVVAAILVELGAAVVGAVAPGFDDELHAARTAERRPTQARMSDSTQTEISALSLATGPFQPYSRI